MSFQHMLEMARRHGMPLVVTDPNGKAPVVVLPLEVYEALVDGAPKKKEPIVVPVRDESSLTPLNVQIEPENLAELSMEERFYMEPLDESRQT